MRFLPQLILLMLFVLSFCTHSLKAGEKRESRYNPVADLIGTLVISALLHWGGFWNDLLIALR